MCGYVMTSFKYLIKSNMPNIPFWGYIMYIWCWSCHCVKHFTFYHISRWFSPIAPSILSHWMLEFVYFPTAYNIAIHTNERTNLTLYQIHVRYLAKMHFFNMRPLKYHQNSRIDTTALNFKLNWWVCINVEIQSISSFSNDILGW